MAVGVIKVRWAGGGRLLLAGAQAGQKKCSTVTHSEDAFREHELMNSAIQPAHLTIELRSARMAPVKTALRTATEVSNSCTL